LKWFPTGFPTNTTLLELSNNQITQVDQHSTFAYPMLEALDLSNNSITLFHAETIYNHENLTLLYLRDNPKLPKLPWLPDSLIDLDISNTGYALSHPADLDLKDGYDVPDTLQYLKIENSGLTAWPTSLPSKLKVLKLGGNKLTTIGDLNDCDFLGSVPGRQPDRDSGWGS
jgi:Leucine-rich repeat (LRR) protein